jgi:hypothetical protein
MKWLDAHNTGYLAWTWDAWPDACAKGPVLITDYQGTPTAYGQGFKDHLARLAQTGSATPAAAKTVPMIRANMTGIKTAQPGSIAHACLITTSRVARAVHSHGVFRQVRQRRSGEARFGAIKR